MIFTPLTPYTMNNYKNFKSFRTAFMRFCSGRTLTEMLGVLAIIGVLSIAGLFGYKIAMNYHKANETIHDVMLRATNVPMMWEDYTSIDDADFQFLFPDLKPIDTNPVNYAVKVYSEPENSNYEFRVLVSDVPQAVCKRILEMNPTAVDLIKTGASATSNPEPGFAIPADCVGETGRMGFYFDEDFRNDPLSPGPGPGPGPGPEPNPTPCDNDANCDAGQCCRGGVCTSDCDNVECNTKADCTGNEAGECCNDGVCGQCPADPCADNPTECTSCQIEGVDEDGCLTCRDPDPQCDPEQCEVPATDEYGCYTKCGEKQCEMTKCPEGQIPDTYDEYNCCILTCKEDPCAGKTGEEYDCCDRDGELKTVMTGDCCKTEYTYCTADETVDETCVPLDTCCEADYNCEAGCCGADGKCTTEDCTCKTCSELACNEQGLSCVLGDDNCAKGCAGICPEGFSGPFCKENNECVCLGSTCKENHNGQSGAQNSWVCCGIAQMTDICGDNDRVEDHVWVGDIFTLGDGIKNYCCCNETQSEECCQASKGETYHLMDEDGDGTKECVEYFGCIYEYPENLVGATGPDCWYSYPKNLEGKVLPDCTISGYSNPEEHCKYTDENGNQQDSGYPCRTYRVTESCKSKDSDGNCVSSTYEQDAEKSCRHSYSIQSGENHISYSCFEYWHEETLGSLSTSNCPSGEYCRVVYPQNECSGSLGSTGASTMYGVCTAMDSNSASCPQGVHLTEKDLLEVEGCDTGKYCRLLYSANNCSSNIGSTGASTIYGICTPMDSNSSSCPQVVHLTEDDLKATIACPSGYYCNLQWSAQDCSSSIGSTGANPMYGACLAMTSNSASCPN